MSKEKPKKEDKQAKTQQEQALNSNNLILTRLRALLDWLNVFNP